MRIIFAGTPTAAVPTLAALIESSHEVVAVITRPPARAGRGRKLVPSPVAELAHTHGIPLIEAANMREDATCEAIAAIGAELGVVVAYGALIPQVVLDMPTRGWVNLHFSDLPRWRGAAPVQRAIMAGDARTASCIFQLEAGLDTGPVFSREEVIIGVETSDELLERMSVAGGAQMVALLDAMEAGTAASTPQDEGEDGAAITHAARLLPGEGFITFNGTCSQTDAHIRAFTSNPGAWTLLPEARRLKLGPVTHVDTQDLPVGCPPTAPSGTVHAARKAVYVACSDGWVALGQVAPAGKGWMDAPAWARGARLEPGTRLGASHQPEGEEK
nr:methionyl-tRNA formyltransferase [Schaalia sp. Marseille-Q2122]